MSIIRRLSSAGGSGAVAPVTVTFIAGAAVVDTDQAATDREIFGQANRRQVANLTGMKFVTFEVAGAAAAGAGSIAIVRYSLNDGASFSDFSPACTVLIDGLGAAVSTLASARSAVPVEAQTDNVVVAAFTDGDAVTTDDPSYTTLVALFEAE